ncbi:Cof-type HAD-IIB family hydrolase [Oceanivirga salmonicida]|uniref:Cof-type HAD-IIB family hydrolase n=1 Tax=Oceanivirga salmonicida TaxID=1769291 RepID=UPI000835A36D|nr:Cof-type HAD-IIB family hydrolase [Oceanivirga salmonicida]
MYKLIATDMDGTLLTSDKKISKENKESIIKAQENGVTFVLASGRIDEAMIPFAKELQMDKFGGYILSYNGSKIINCKTNDIVFSQPLTKQDIEYLLEISKKFDIAVVTYIDKILYSTKHHEYVDIESKITGFPIKIFDNIDEIKVDTVGKCMFIGDTDKTKELLLYLQEKDNNRFFTTLSDPHFLEVLHKNVNKGNSLLQLGNILGIKQKNIIACGDSYNDIELLKSAGLAIAADNAVKDIKAISNYISKNNNEHILEDIIKKYVL